MVLLVFVSPTPLRLEAVYLGTPPRGAQEHVHFLARDGGGIVITSERPPPGSLTRQRL